MRLIIDAQLPSKLCEILNQLGIESSALVVGLAVAFLRPTLQGERPLVFD